MTRHPYAPVFGAVTGAGAVRFAVWAPDARSVRLRLSPAPGRSTREEWRSADLAPGGSGLWIGTVEGARQGDRYAYSLDDAPPLPDPASRFQPDGVHGWSEIVDPSRFAWTDGEWNGLDPRRAVLYELHVGTFTPEGTFAAAAEKIPYLADLDAATGSITFARPGAFIFQRAGAPSE